jgi:hypothetical protein
VKRIDNAAARLQIAIYQPTPTEKVRAMTTKQRKATYQQQSTTIEEKTDDPSPIMVQATPDSEYLPGPLKPATDKEWATAKFKPPKLFLGDMLFHSHTIGMFVMKTDAGKSQWAVGLGLAMAYGRAFCEWSPVNRACVLYIEGETSNYSMQRTIRAQRKAHGIRDEDVTKNFTLITRQTHGPIPFLNVKVRRNKKVDQAEQEGKIWLFTLIDKYKPDFIIFDSVQSLCPTMVSTSATKWIMELMKPIIELIAQRGIGQLWLHHTDKSQKMQHGTGARSWGFTLELYGVPNKPRGIDFNLTFPGKKKDDLGNNADFEDRRVQLSRGADGVSRWVVGPVTTIADTTPNAAHRPNESARIAMRVFRELVGDKPGVWIPSDINSEWCKRCIAAGISDSDSRANQNRAFTRGRNHCVEQRWIERRVEDGYCQLFPPEPSSDLEQLDPDSATIQ